MHIHIVFFMFSTRKTKVQREREKQRNSLIDNAIHITFVYLTESGDVSHLKRPPTPPPTPPPTSPNMIINHSNITNNMAASAEIALFALSIMFI